MLHKNIEEYFYSQFYFFEFGLRMFCLYFFGCSMLQQNQRALVLRLPIALNQLCTDFRQVKMCYFWCSCLYNVIVNIYHPADHMWTDNIDSFKFTWIWYNKYNNCDLVTLFPSIIFLWPKWVLFFWGKSSAIISNDLWCHYHGDE